MGKQLIGELIRDKRKRLGLTQRRFADIMGVSANTVARWERGSMGVRNVSMLCLALAAINGEGKKKK